MTEITFSSDLGVELIQHVGDDRFVAQTARVSTSADLEDIPESKDVGLIGYLMRKRHGSPFEHNIFTFRINAPIFVAREAFRHRIASYNEVSARYTEVEPKFYVYPTGRPLVQAGSSAHPELQTHPDPESFKRGNDLLRKGYELDWGIYQALLKDEGWALEAARVKLPVASYTSWYVSMNARALMNFLSLRIDAEGNTFETKPLWEIEQIALQMEAHFREKMPVTAAAFEKYGRVSP